MILLEKLMILTPLQKLPKHVGDLGKLIVAKGFKKLPKFYGHFNTRSVIYDRRAFIRIAIPSKLNTDSINHDHFISILRLHKLAIDVSSVQLFEHFCFESIAFFKRLI